MLSQIVDDSNCATSFKSKTNSFVNLLSKECQPASNNCILSVKHTIETIKGINNADIESKKILKLIQGFGPKEISDQNTVSVRLLKIFQPIKLKRPVSYLKTI